MRECLDMAVPGTHGRTTHTYSRPDQVSPCFIDVSADKQVFPRVPLYESANIIPFRDLQFPRSPVDAAIITSLCEDMCTQGILEEIAPNEAAVTANFVLVDKWRAPPPQGEGADMQAFLKRYRLCLDGRYCNTAMHFALLLTD